MPVANPTGNPFTTLRLTVPKDKETLQKLQVKVDLKKIGVAPRAYRQKLVEAEEDHNMEVSENNTRKLICDRFTAIEKAQRSLHPLTI